ncbi:phage portal protein [Shewanella submarina]|uniref:Phage portal protein n=1 Tax=Shewanella submarina TaxID=2016376 RepID=A0ABV7G554_9GAMM|nr:phage portal protein [Shewanella submarina]MCL1038342.1 phage portal protein [Shewanella submarina]
MYFRQMGESLIRRSASYRQTRSIMQMQDGFNPDHAPQTPDTLVNALLRKAKGHARNQYYTNEFAKRAVQLITDGVCGADGFTLRSRATDTRYQPDDIARLAIQTAFTNWCRPKHCDLRQGQSFTDITRSIVDALCYDGEAFIRLHYDKRVGLRLELIDSLFIDISKKDAITSTAKGNYVRFGIEYNQKDQPVAYYVKKNAGSDSDLTSGYAIGSYERVTADKMLHVFQREWVGQRRGFPILFTSANTLEQGDEYTDYALQAAKFGAQFRMFAEVDKDLTDMMFDANGNVIEAEVAAAPNDVTVMPKGYSIKTSAREYPASQYDGFISRILRRCFAGVGLDYSIAANDLAGVNYSSLKVGSDTQKTRFMAIQRLLIDQFLTPVFDEWMEYQHSLQLIKIKNKALSKALFFYLPHEWYGRRWSALDPAKQATAYEKGLAANTTSVSAIIRETSQRDPIEVFKEIAEERAIMEELGITQSQVMEAVTEPPPDGDTEEETEAPQ